MGSFSIDMIANENEVMERSLEIVQVADQEREAALVSTVVTAAAKGSNGVIRLDDTLGAVYEGRVKTLIVSDGYHAPGYRCKQLRVHYLAATERLPVLRRRGQRDPRRGGNGHSTGHGTGRRYRDR